MPLTPAPTALCCSLWLDAYHEWNIVPMKDKSLLNHRVTSHFGAVKIERGSWVCFRETLNKDNLENGLQHRAASVSPCSLHTHTRLPKAALLMFVLILLPELGCFFFLRCMAMVQTDWTKDNLTKLEGVMLFYNCRPLCFSVLIFMTQ